MPATTGTVRTPDGRTLSLNSGRASPTWAGPASPDGTFRVPGLPEGAFRVFLVARIRGVRFRASARETGEALEIPIGGR